MIVSLIRHRIRRLRRQLTLTLLAALLSGAVAQANSCQSEQDRADRLTELRNAPTGGHLQFQLDITNRDLADCQQRAVVTEYDRLRSERSQAGQTYVSLCENAAGVQGGNLTEMQAARDAWREANTAVNEHRTANPGLQPQPYSDSLSDSYRYWCMERDGKGSFNNPKNLGITCWQ